LPCGFFAIDTVPQSLCQQEGLISLNSQRAILNVEKKSSGFSQFCNRRKTDGSKVTVPPGTQSGTALRLRGKGMPRLHAKSKGDLYVV
jgi:hypothetical protein